MIRYTTRNSVYEVDPTAQTVRRVSGTRPGLAPLDDDEPHAFTELHELAERLVFVFEGGRTLTTTRVERVEYRPTPWLVEEGPADLCEATTYPATLETPAEGCEEPAEPGSDFCAGHDPARAEDAAEERAEADREEALFRD